MSLFVSALCAGVGLLRFMGNAHAHVGQSIAAGRFVSAAEMYAHVLHPLQWIVDGLCLGAAPPINKQVCG